MTVKIFIVVTSDTRGIEEDESGRLAVSLLSEKTPEFEAHITGRALIPNDRHRILEVIKEAQKVSDFIIVIGGTGLSRKDTTIEAVESILEKRADGFGELFRSLSFKEIGTKTIVSRTLMGRAGDSIVFALPGSPSAVRLALEKIIIPEIPHLMEQLAKQS